MENNPIVFLILAILGASLGSFCMSMTMRFCENKPLLSLRSYCFSCHQKLKPLELIPIFSYIFLRFKCKTCHAKIPFYVFLAEFFGIVFIWIAYLLSQDMGEFIHLLIFLFVLFALSYIDLKFQAVPQKLLWLIFFVAFSFAFSSDEFAYFFIFENFQNGFMVQAFIFAGFLFLLKNFIAFIKNFKTKNIQENLGDADIIILASMAGIFGFKSVFIILFTASLLSLPFFVYNESTKLAFLPFINAAFVMYLIYLIVQELI
ncbi:prepilin peptidase [Campylobacter coli]|nr:prepilin peptidase [Campylobacter coli]EAI7224365.1 prepilin peptidase [Campylobacter coli]